MKVNENWDCQALKLMQNPQDLYDKIITICIHHYFFQKLPQATRRATRFSINRLINKTFPHMEHFYDAFLFQYKLTFIVIVHSIKERKSCMFKMS